MTTFSEFMRTASDQEKEAIYNIVLEKSIEEQNKTLEEHLNKIENEQEIKLLTPGMEDVFSNVNKSKRFKNKHALADFLSMSNAVAGQFRLHELPTGNVWELVFVNKEDVQ